MSTLDAPVKPELFMAVLTQDAGCDYTIGCGTQVVTLNARDANSAVDEAKEILYAHRGTEMQLNRLQVLAIAGTFEVPVSEWYKKFDEDARKAAEESEREKDLAQLQMLAEKLGVQVTPAG